MKNSRELIKNIVVDALFIAFIVVFTFVPYLGYIQIGPVSVTTVHLFVTLAAAIYGWKKGLLVGFIFGLSSLIKAINYPGGFDYFFVNPFVSVLPRMLFGLISGLIFDVIKKHLTYKKYYIVIPFVAVLVTFLHTLLTLTCLYVFGCLDIFKISYALGLSSFIEQYKLNDLASYCLFLTIITLFGAIGEAILSAIVTPISYFALTQISDIKESEEKKFKADSLKKSNDFDTISTEGEENILSSSKDDKILQEEKDKDYEDRF